MTDKHAKKSKTALRAPARRAAFPFTALVGQDEMKLALLLNVIAPSIGGVLVMGHRGTGKSTAVRALAELLPDLKTMRGCPFNCDPLDASNFCVQCRELSESGGRLAHESRSVPVVDLPLGATEDRVCGTIDFERALREGVKAFEPGLLARANRGFLYIDEVNLLEDHLVDLLLDVAATGRNIVEREGISTEHPARFVLVGSGNPEEGELRPQLLDRFGLYAEVQTVTDVDSRVLIVERREDFERDPEGFAASFEAEQTELRRTLIRARRNFVKIEVPRTLLRLIAELCLQLKVDGHRGELTITRAARALAAYEGRKRSTEDDVRRVAALALRHRLRRDPLEQTSGRSRVDEAVGEIFGDGDEGGNDDGPHGLGGDTAPSSNAGNGSPSAGDAGARGNPARGGPDASDARRQEDERIVPPVKTHLPEISLNAGTVEKHPKKRTQAAHAGARGMRATIYGRRGRYVNATKSKTTTTRSLALDATLRAAAPSLKVSRNASSAAVKSGRGQFDISPADLRYKRFRRKSGTLFILAVDTSGSMAVNRIGQAKGAIAHLLRRSYVRRDRIALVSFRERAAELLLAPSGSQARALKLLDALPVGGATPLPAGLLRVLEVARRVEETPRVMLVLFTDGRANVSLEGNGKAGGADVKRRIALELERLGAALQAAGVSSLIVDTQGRFTAGGEGEELARSLGGRYVHLPRTQGEEVLSEIFADA